MLGVVGIGVCLAAVAPAFAQEQRDMRFGIVLPWAGIGKTGVAWDRCGGGASRLGDWPHTEPEQDVYRWSESEGELANQHLGEGLIPAPILSYTPQWASSAPADVGGRQGYPPRDYADYAEFCAQCASRFRQHVPAWEIWNEPNIGFFNGTIPQYAELLKVGAIGIRQGNPQARVIFGGTAGVDIWFIRRCYELGVGPYFDIMAAHPYQWGSTFNDGWFVSKLAGLRALMDEYGDTDKTIVLNEFGWVSRNGDDTSENIQARLLVQSYVTALSLPHLGVTGAAWFSVKDWGDAGHGIYRNNSSKKPAWYSLQAMVRELSHRPYLGSRKAGDARVHAFGAREAGPDNVLVTWAAHHQPVPVEFPVGHATVEIHDIMGQPVDAAPQEGVLRLQARPEPMYVHLPAETVQQLIEPVARRSFPPPSALPPRPSVAATVYPQEGTARPHLVAGQATSLKVRIFNGSGQPGQADLQFSLGNDLARARLNVPVEANKVTEAAISLHTERTTPEGLIPLHVSGTIAGEPLRKYDLPVRIAPGPVIEFYSNSHLDKAYIVDAKGGCAESIRFGTSWTYKLPVRQPGLARVTMHVGAHMARTWSVSWSQDNETWHPLYSGQSNLAWHNAVTPDLAAGDLRLKVEGEDVQVREVVVVFGLPLARSAQK